MAEVIVLTPQGAPPEDDYWVLVERESAQHSVVVEFERDGARFVYGPRSFASQGTAVEQARHWADQHGIDKVYVH